MSKWQTIDEIDLTKVNTVLIRTHITDHLFFKTRIATFFHILGAHYSYDEIRSFSECKFFVIS